MSAIAVRPSVATEARAGITTSTPSAGARGLAHRSVLGLGATSYALRRLQRTLGQAGLTRSAAAADMPPRPSRREAVLRPISTLGRSLRTSVSSGASSNPMGAGLARSAAVVAPRSEAASVSAMTSVGVARMPAPPVSAAPAAPAAPGVPRGAGGRPIQVRRSGVTSLPVSGNGSIAASVATSVAGEVARSAAEEAVAERLQRSSAGDGSMPISRAVDGDGGLRVQRAVGDDVDGVAQAIDLEAQRDELMRFTMTDEFEERLLEFLEDRLLGEIERRGGRYGGWFA